MKLFVYVLHFHHGMILEEIEADSIGDADKQMLALGCNVSKRPDIGCFVMHPNLQKSYINNYLANICSA